MHRRLSSVVLVSPVERKFLDVSISANGIDCTRSCRAKFPQIVVVGRKSLAPWIHHEREVAIGRLSDHREGALGSILVVFDALSIDMGNCFNWVDIYLRHLIKSTRVWMLNLQ